MKQENQMLTRAVRQLSDIPEAEVKRFADKFYPRVLSKNSFLLREGEPALLAGFVTKGVVREYFTNQEGREFNKNFAFQGEFTGSYLDLISQKPSTVSIQAMARTEILTAPFQDIAEIFDSSYHWQRFARKLVEQLFEKKARREYQLATMSAKNRYETFASENPEMLDSLPHYQIASYLAITPVAFSRIRKRVSPQI